MCEKYDTTYSELERDNTEDRPSAMILDPKGSIWILQVAGPCTVYRSWAIHPFGFEFGIWCPKRKLDVLQECIVDLEQCSY
jgi:hypothetical protein